MACFRFRKLFSGTSSPQEGKITDIKPDPFVDSKMVVGLSHENFQAYMKKLDAALVMFYEKEDPKSTWSRKHFKRAAETTHVPNHGYAAVDCDKYSDFCVTEGVPFIPYMKLYSKGKKVAFALDPKKLCYQDMRDSIEMAPLYALER